MSQEIAKYETTGDVSPYSSPQQEVERAHKMAKVLQDVVRQAKLSKAFTKGGKEHLFFEAWQTIGRFFNCAPEIEWSRPLTHNDKIIGWEARAIVSNTNGQIIASAESMCAKDEDNWKNRPAYAIRSMAQTRASSKALRQAFAWVAVLAGYAATPAEEMDGVDTKQEPSPAAEEPLPQALAEYISEAQRKRLYAIYKASGKTDNDVQAYLFEQYGIETSKAIPKQHYDAICKWAEEPTERKPGDELLY